MGVSMKLLPYRRAVFLVPVLLACAPSIHAAEILFGVDSNNEVLNIDPTTGFATVAKTFSPTGAAIGIGTTGSLLYVLPGYAGGIANASQLLSFDPANSFAQGASANIGLAAANVAALAQGDIAFNSAGTLFIASSTQQSGLFSGTNGALYSEIGGTTTVLNGSFAPKFDGIAFNSTGTLYGLSREVANGPGSFIDSLYTLNTTNGTPTLVGLTGINDSTLNAFAGLAFSSNGTLYAIVGNTVASRLYTINPATGAATLVNPILISGNPVGGIEGMTFFTTGPPPSVPEPGTFGLISGALGLLVAIRRRLAS
jgi:hypothetical protein